MAMTRLELVDFFAQRGKQTADAMEAALRRRELDLVAINVYEAFKSRIMEGLIRWRCDMGSPLECLKGAVEIARKGAALLIGDIGIETVSREMPLETASIIAFLTDQPIIEFDNSMFEHERLLDSVLGIGLHNGWENTKWALGLETLGKRKRAKLAVETYSVYDELIHASTKEAPALVDQASQLFARRKKDGYYAGGIQTEGGGPDNDFTVDYRLAAIMKKIGFRGDSIHAWKWD